MMKKLELRIPPVAVWLAFGGVMWLLSLWLPVTSWLAPLRIWGLIVLVLLGGLVGLAGVRTFQRAQTSLNPLEVDKASQLVTHGIYRWTRNPMYLGLLLVLFGWGVFWAHWLLLLLPLGYVAYLTRFQIQPEERALAERFGEAFDVYRGQVRRWI